MPLPTFATQDEIPEAVRSGYIERNGKWVPEIDDSGLRENHRRATEEARSLKDSLRTHFGDMRLDDVAEIVKSHRASEEDRQKKAGEHDKVLEKRLAERDAEWKKKFDDVAPYKPKYEDRELDIAIRDAAGKAGVISEDMRHVLAIVKGHRVRYDEKSGKPVVYDADGDVTGLTVEKFFSETFRAEAPKFYSASGGSGGGASAANGGGGGSRPGTISRTDNAAMLANLDKIARGEVKVA